MKKYLLISLLSLVLFSCVDRKQKEVPKNRTVLVYIIGDNNLYNYALDDIDELENVWQDGYDGTVLVYLNPRSSTIPSKLYRITKGEKSGIESVELKNYGVKQNACDPAVMKQVIADTRVLSKSNSYALVLWSHGTGWIPKGGNFVKSAIPPVTEYSFGANDTYGDEMNIDQLASAMPTDLVFDYIAFDACHMASVEVAYQLRNSTKYVVASAAEMYAAGFPYTTILGDMLSKEANVVGVAQKTYDSYKETSSTMSVIDCSKLSDLAQSVKEIVQGAASKPVLGSPIQEFGRSSFKGLYYDLGDFVNKTWAGSTGLAKFNDALNKAVTFKANTTWLFSTIEVKTHCGLMGFIPRTSQPINLDYYSTKLEWSKDSGLSQISF